MSNSGSPSKKTIYIDVDEEITGIIDKLRSADESILALVLPKRATVLQSVVNMKLLKRAATQSDKKIVLITSEATLLPLAGAAGIHVASNLQSRPYIPEAPTGTPAPRKPEEPEDKVDDPVIDPKTPVGNLIDPKDKTTEPIEIDNRPKAETAAAAAAASAKAKGADAKKPKKDKNKMVPNFHKFRALLFIGAGALIALIVFMYWALAIAPSASITLRTESSESKVDAEFRADTSASELDLKSQILPAKQQQTKKTEIEKVQATGEKDNGTKASGNISLRNCGDNSVTIPAGTGISSGNFTFITQDSVRLGDANFDSNKNCKTNGSHTGSVAVVAKSNGDQFNLSSRSYIVAGFSSVLAQGEQMSGGTSKITKVVSAKDVDAAKKKISDKQNSVVEELKGQLKQDDLIGLVDSFTASNSPNFVVSPAIDAEAAEVTVSGEVTYSMLGVKEDDLKKLVQDQAKDKVDTSKQSILNYGFDDATFEVGDKNRSSTEINLSTTLLAGPEINQEQLKSELKGQKSAEVESALKSRPGITEAKVTFKPFWVSKIPGKENKVNFIIEQADGTQITQ